MRVATIVVMVLPPLKELLPGLNVGLRTPIACRSTLPNSTRPSSGASGSTVRGISECCQTSFLARPVVHLSFTGSEDFNTQVGDGLEWDT